MEFNEYFVTIGVRPAELSGLKELPSSTKDRITPILLLAPWLGTSPLSRAIDKFEESFHSRPYFIDVDTYYRINENGNEAKATWSQISSPPPNIDAWWELLESYPHANPCIILNGSSFESARDQIEWARERNRYFCIRLNLDQFVIPTWMPELVAELAADGALDYAVMFEFGWVRDALTVAALASGYTNTFFSILPPEIPIAISCTSFPSDFTQFDGLSECRFSNRDLIAFVRQGTNHPKVVYGDWASTKPRQYGMASPPKTRIDYPVDSAWIVARDGGEPISFAHAASRIVNSSYWTGNLGVWGEQLIESTAAGQDFAIDTMPKMYAVRINIHLHRQAYFGDLPPPTALDEDWSDDDL